MGEIDQSFRPLALFLQKSLEELENILLAVSQKDYVLGHRSSMGSHMRHCLEYIEEFIKGVPLGVINYDKRKRQRLLETSPQKAFQKISSFKKELKSLENSLFLKKDTVFSLDFILTKGEGYETFSCKTGLERELLFITQHTLHHLAILEFILKERNIPISLNTKSPGTLVFEKSLRV